MERLAVALLLLSLGPVIPAAGQPTSAPKEKTVTLSDEQKQAIINAAQSVDSRQKTPKEFSPSLGATVPKEVYLHAFTPGIVQETPLLKEYWYAFLDREIVLIDALEMKVAAVIDLPQKMISTQQPSHGAAEPSSTNAKGNADGPVGSVPSHTSPESIK